MQTTLPSIERIQECLSGIVPNKYLEPLADAPGLLLLRAKSPDSIYQGLHLAVSKKMSLELASLLEGVAANAHSTIQLMASSPDGRAWFYLYTSGVNFRSWSKLTVERIDNIEADEVHVKYASGSVIQLQLSGDALLTISDALQSNQSYAKPLPLKLIRMGKPNSKARHLWLWRWY
jgi:hypothetical protein